ncbi:uncharacterized protein LOC144155817 [Haemaphysalis longicornis]
MKVTSGEEQLRRVMGLCALIMLIPRVSFGSCVPLAGSKDGSARNQDCRPTVLLCSPSAASMLCSSSPELLNKATSSANLRRGRSRGSSRASSSHDFRARVLVPGASARVFGPVHGAGAMKPKRSVAGHVGGAEAMPPTDALPEDDVKAGMPNREPRKSLRVRFELPNTYSPPCTRSQPQRFEKQQQALQCVVPARKSLMPPRRQSHVLKALENEAGRSSLPSRPRKVSKGNEEPRKSGGKLPAKGCVSDIEPKSKMPSRKKNLIKRTLGLEYKTFLSFPYISFLFSLCLLVFFIYSVIALNEWQNRLRVLCLYRSVRILVESTVDYLKLCFLSCCLQDGLEIHEDN